MNAETIEAAKTAVRLYAESRPRPLHVTQKQAAEMLDVSPPTIHRMVRAGRLKLNGLGMIPISQVDQVLAVS